jgi:hypothetical protein
MVACSVTGIDHFPGMIPVDSIDPANLASGPDSGPRSVARNRKALETLIDEAMILVKDGLGMDPEGSKDRYVSIMPSRPGESPEACCAWRGRNGLSFICSTIPMPQVAGRDSSFASFDATGRPRFLTETPPGWQERAKAE